MMLQSQLRLLIFAVLCPMMLSAFFACKHKSSASPTGISFLSIDIPKAKLLIEDPAAIIVDVRTPEEISGGKISHSALELDYRAADFKEKLGQLDKNKKYLIYCKSDGRSGKTLEMMKTMGFIDCSDLDGGYTAWENAH